MQTFFYDHKRLRFSSIVDVVTSLGLNIETNYALLKNGRKPMLPIF